MLDVENVKTILQAEVNKRKKAKAKWEKYRSSENSNRSLEELYERRYHMYVSRFDGMCDILYDLGLLAWTNDENEVFVEKRVTYDDILF